MHVQLSKNTVSRNNKIMQSKLIQNNVKHDMKMMSSTIPNHSPNTTHLAVMGVLGYSAQIYRLSIEGATSRHLKSP